jgi:two-component system chemotaxis response regulator CheB
VRPVATLPSRVDLVVIGISTGGPNALAEMLPGLPASMPVPVLVVQHMPATFTRHLADRLDRLSPLRVAEAQGGEVIRPGEVWIAPGGLHLAVHQDARGTVLRTNLDAPENSCRPAADVLFRSAAATFGKHVLGVVMTGMGYDGRRGAAVIKAAGGRVIVQDQASSVVWGMPSGVVADGNADVTVPLSGIANEILRAARRERTLSASARSAR